MKRALLLLVFSVAPAFASQTWFVRADGGTRVSTNVPGGLCDGLSDLPAAGATAKHCAFNDFRYLWDDDSGVIGLGAWVIAGGDTIVVRGCHALTTQQNPSNPNCRIGWDIDSGGGINNNWCNSVGNNDCTNPAIPAGTAGAHTRILGGCVLAGNCNTGNVTNRGNLTQLFGGFGLRFMLNFASTSYVDFQGFELTTHNGTCSHHGAPNYPTSCSTSLPASDYADNGVLTNNTTSNILFQDVYMDGYESNGVFGPIGGPITMTRVNISFNASAAWQFDNGGVANGAGSQILGSYITMNGNGCKQEYPLVHAFPAVACWDSNSGGFGDTWSGQSPNAVLDVFNCDHCTYMYNTKDADIGPHIEVASLTRTSNFYYGNMGAAIKLNNTVGANQLFQNNLIVGNCYRMSQLIPGAAQNFSTSTGLGGSYLSNFCRASGATVANAMRASATIKYLGNTIVTAAPIVFEYGCGFINSSNVFVPETNCGTTVLTVADNNILGYTDPIIGGPQVGLYSFDDAFAAAALVSSFNNEFNFRNGDTCGVNNITCVNPALISMPTTPWPGSEAALDVFNALVGGNSFFPAGGSPLLGAGTTLGGLTTDYYATTRPSPPAMGGVELSGAPPVVATPTASPVAGTYTSTQSVTLSTATGGATICYTTNGTTPGAAVAGTCDGGSTIYSGAISVATTATIKALGTLSGDTNSGVFSSLYTITPASTGVTIVGVKLSGNVKIQ